MKKPRADSILDGLPAHQQQAIERWLYEENLSQQEVQERIVQDFGVRCSRESVRGFYHRLGQRRNEDRILESAIKANAVLDKFEENPADLYTATLKLVSTIALGEATKEGKAIDVETLYNLTKLMIANRKEDVRSEALQLDRERFQRDTCKLFLKWQANDAAAKIANSSQSNSEKIERLGELMFGETWK